MKEPQQQTLLDDEATLVTSGEETTLVAPRFDAEETLVARPVVPLEADAAPAPPALAYRSPRAPRRTGMLALLLVSVLVGGVLGGAGLYFYQRQSPSPATTETTNEPAADAAALPAPAAEDRPAEPSPEPSAQLTEAPATATNAPAAKETTSKAEEKTPNASEQAPPAAAPAREPASASAAERRTTPAEAAPKRGKKAEHDEEVARRTNTSRSDGNVARTEEPQARRVDSIFYRQRRANRRARRDNDDDVDRLRRIFEGGPQ